MHRAEPITILRFLTNHFDAVKDLYECQSREGVIRKEIFQEIVKRHGAEITNQFFDYKILKPNGEDYEFRKSYYDFLEFILVEFRPVLPESIEKYYGVINELFRKIKQSSHEEKMILEARIAELAEQIREFLEQVEKNTLRLLAESRELKANADKIDYRQKLHKASFWIDYYIIPLNKILDVNNQQSIACKLAEVAEYVNQKRLVFPDEKLRQRFEKLYYTLVQVNDDLIRNSKILTNELLPLIERIRTESTILSGWIDFLKNPFRVETPPMLKENIFTAYSKDMYYHTKEFFEQFEAQDDVIVQDENVELEKWIYNKAVYKEKLMKQLPVENFFEWIQNELKNEFGITDTEKFFTLASLMFEEDLKVEFQEAELYIKTTNTQFKVPKIKIDNHGLPQ
jgi:hypothetical protein